uniref:barstar family protein n=1 Tax=Streptomyces zhihengii TaxID=1818004 RepID=UPI0027DDCA9A|nr:hypothetical protein [Streptomyces zhihengii]
MNALWDRLSTDVERPVEIVWKNTEATSQNLGEESFSEIRELLLRVQSQDESFGWDDRLTVTFE